METKYVCENGNGPYVTDMPYTLKARVLQAVDRAEVYAILARFAAPKPCGLLLYAAAVEMVLLAPNPLGIRQLYTMVGRLYGKKMEATRRCMDYAKRSFDYAVCNDCLFGGQLSEKAFSYVTVPELIGRVAQAVIEWQTESCQVSL